jgi:hypothetical protein
LIGLVLRLAFPAGAPSETQRDAVHNATAEAQAAGATAQDVTAALEDRGDESPWQVLRGLAGRLRRRRRSARAAAPAPADAGDAREPEASGLRAAVARVRGGDVRFLDSADGRNKAEVLENQGDDLERGLPVRIYAADDKAHRQPRATRRLRTAEDLAEFGLVPESAGREVAAP